MNRFLKRACKFCEQTGTVEVLRMPQPNEAGTKVEYVRATKCSYCGAWNA